MKARSHQLQNTLDLLVLKTLAAQGPLHGYAIVNHIQAASEEELRVEEGSLYPALHRMESDGWVEAEWKLSATHRRVKLYRVTAAGRKQLAREQESWERLSRAVGKVLHFA
jgi:PadR family transcriptional regulator PadR